MIMDYRIGIIITVAFIIAVISGPVIIPILRKIKAGQSIREDGPQSHLIKAGTPTMGGFIIIISTTLACLIAGGGLNSDMTILLVSFYAFAAIGFIDDFVKVCKHRNLGLTAKQKLAFQIIIAIILAVYQSMVSDSGTTIYIPFIKNYLDLGILYIPFVVFVVVSMVNAVNLTDGLDGLASGVTFIVALFIAIIGQRMGHTTPVYFISAIAGACLGFLIYNKYPAKVFMGDTGSLALGGALSAAAILMNIELVLPIAGGIFVMEALSVIIQVISFKSTGRRVFRMAPLHHHFEIGGWKEIKVVIIFWAVTLCLCLISLLIF